MTMILESNTRTGLRNSSSNTSLDNLLTKPEQEKRVPRNQRLSKPSPTRGLALAKKAEARYQASRRHSNPRLSCDDDDEEEVVVEDMEKAESDNNKPRRRGIARTASMDAGNKRPSIRRNLRRNKSCEDMPVQRRPLLDRSSSSRRFGSRRSLMDRSKSERRFALHDREQQQDKPMRPPSRSRLDGSSDDGARSSRRRRPTMADDSSSNRRRVGRTASMSGSSGGSAGGVRRRGTRVARSNSRRESSLRGLPDFERMGSNSGRDITPDTSPARTRTAVSKRGKGLDDSSRRRKEPTLSKLSINELRNRLVGTEEKEACQGSDGSNSQGFEFEANWDNDIPQPLESDLNKDQF